MSKKLTATNFAGSGFILFALAFCPKIKRLASTTETLDIEIDQSEQTKQIQMRPWGYKAFFMLNSAEH